MSDLLHADACARLERNPPGEESEAIVHERQFDHGVEPACKVGCEGCAGRVAQADEDQGRRPLTDEDFQFLKAFENGTRPRTASVVFAHRGDGREVGLCVDLEGPHRGAVGSVHASAYIGADRVAAWARQSALVERAVRRFR